MFKNSDILKEAQHISITMLSWLMLFILRITWNTSIPDANLTTYQKGAYYSGIKLFNTFPTSIKSLSYDAKFLSQHWKIIFCLTLFTL
jgi:hypothetical protein